MSNSRLNNTVSINYPPRCKQIILDPVCWNFISRIWFHFIHNRLTYRIFNTHNCLRYFNSFNFNHRSPQNRANQKGLDDPSQFFMSYCRKNIMPQIVLASKLVLITVFGITGSHSMYFGLVSGANSFFVSWISTQYINTRLK